jgi:oxygen-independent coproporphyrinogen-3 oxidase
LRWIKARTCGARQADCMTLTAKHLTARVPRYTSYPTAPHFEPGVTGRTVETWMQALPRTTPLSLYVHIPFCDSLCWFCGCHTKVVNTYSPVAHYVGVLRREIEQAVYRLGPGRPVRHIHFGGGSPTMLRPDDWRRITDDLNEMFRIEPGAEFAVEIDPRGLGADAVAALAKSGVTRASIGVQDVNPEVQRAINRWQPWEATQDAVARLRDAGIGALNLDLVYGLPHQWADDVKRTVAAAIALTPDRIAMFGYAHVPQMKPHQKLIAERALPGPEARLAQYRVAYRDLLDAGYEAIGLDHYARPHDPMAKAARSGALRRNFQGYTTDPARALIGLGASAISEYPQGYAQNAATTPDWRRLVQDGAVPAVRGRSLSAEDRLRRDVIESLMCRFAADVDQIARAHGRDPMDFAGEWEALADLADEGLCEIDRGRITVPEPARAAVRIVAAVFDAYLNPAFARHAVAV